MIAVNEVGKANSDTQLRIAVRIARALTVPVWRENQYPQPGQLVVETSRMFGADPDAIGWLAGVGQAAYNEDGTGPTREIWDVFPLSGRLGYPRGATRRQSTQYQRWENALFAPVTPGVMKFLVMMGVNVWVGCAAAMQHILDQGYREMAGNA